MSDSKKSSIGTITALFSQGENCALLFYTRFYRLVRNAMDAFEKPIPLDWGKRFQSEITCKSQSYITTDGQSAILS
jgi:hypothetical protein